MKKDKFRNIRLDPETRLCPAFDATGIKKYELITPSGRQETVQDNFTEEHIM